jgi:hypothetical protein
MFKTPIRNRDQLPTVISTQLTDLRYSYTSHAYVNYSCGSQYNGNAYYLMIPVDNEEAIAFVDSHCELEQLPLFA